MKYLLIIFSLCIISFSPLSAEDAVVHNKLKVLSGVNTTYNYTEYFSNQFRLSESETDVDELTDYINSVKYFIDHGEKIIKKYSLEDAINYSDALAKIKLHTPEKFETLDEAMKAFMFSENIALDVIAKDLIGEDEKPIIKKIGTERVLGRKCERWRISYDKMSMETSFDPTLIRPEPQDIETAKLIREYLTPSTSSLDKALGKLFDEVFKLNKSPLRTRLTIKFLGQKPFKQQQDVTKIIYGPIPASVFELPEGYAVNDEGKKKNWKN